MIIREMSKNDLTSAACCSVQAFGGGLSREDCIMPRYKVLCAFADDNETVLSRIDIIERECYYNGGTLRSAAVGGVASRLEARNKGLVRALFDRFLTAEEYGHFDISVLNPFSLAYYAKFGYAPLGGNIRLEMPFECLAGIERCDSVKLCGFGDEDKIIELYNRLASRYNFAFIRTETDDFNLMPFMNNKYTYMYDGADGEGFLSFDFDRQKSEVTVSEIMFDGKTALTALLGFLRAFEGNFENLVFQTLPYSSPVPLLCGDGTKHFRICKRQDSARVMNIKNVLAKHCYPEESGVIIAEFHNIPAGKCEKIAVEYGGGGCNLSETAAAPDVILTPYGASALLLGGISKQNADYIPGVDIMGRKEEILRVFRPDGNIFFSEKF